MWEMGLKWKTIIMIKQTSKLKISMVNKSSRVKLCMLKGITTILLWTVFILVMATTQLYKPPLLLNNNNNSITTTTILDAQLSPPWMNHTRPSQRIYKNNGYIMVSCNGGLNQMRGAICDMVAIARYLNVTLIVPELDKKSFWNDPSDFQDIFDVRHFITSLRDEVRILKALPEAAKKRVEQGLYHSLSPVSWSDLSYYQNQILPLVHKYKIVHLNKTDSRLANNDLPLDIQKLRCKVNFKALKFTPKIEELGQRVISMLRKRGKFLVLHLRYEKDMLSFSGCTQGCTKDEAQELTNMRYAYPWWKEKVIDSDKKRRQGLCPLTPEETALTLKALGIDPNIQIYIAAGEIYGGKRRMESLASSFPNLVRKETLLGSSGLNYFKNHSSQLAALDYLVSLESDIFVPTYDGNMAKVVEGHRRYLGYKQTISLDRKQLVKLIDKYNNGSLTWDEFSSTVKEAHADRIGSPNNRKVIPHKPKEEDYFYTNPYECFRTTTTTTTTTR